MFQKEMIKIFSEIWPMIAIFGTCLILLRIVYLAKNKGEFIFYQEVLMMGFMIYTICLFYVVTFQDVAWWSSSNFIPFKEMFRYDFGSELFFKNVVGNMLMFVPYGFFVSYYLKLKKPYIVFLLSLIVSFTIEIIQLSIGRVFDVDDIVLNVLGGLTGFVIYIIVKKAFKLFPNSLNKAWLYNIIVILGFILFIIYLTKGFSLGV